MRLAFLGTPDAAVPSLRALVDAGHEVVIVITRPDRRRGRGSQYSASPVKAAALEMGLSVGHRVADLEGLELDRGVVVAYGAMIPGAILEHVPMLNVHFSLLPRWRGAAPVERSILAGDVETGVDIMSLEVTLDTGPIHAERRTLVDAKTADQLMVELAALGAEALIEVLASPELLEHPTPQSGEATYAEKLTKETFHLRPEMSAVLVDRTVRLGRAFTFIDGRRLRVLEGRVADETGVAGALLELDDTIALLTSDGAFILDTVQPEGSTPMTARAWLSGARLDLALARWG